MTRMTVKCLIGMAIFLSSGMAIAEEGVPSMRDTVSLNGVEFAFRLCPPGDFLMGSSEDARSLYENGFIPQHRVRLTRAFWMQETEVTQAQ